MYTFKDGLSVYNIGDAFWNTQLHLLSQSSLSLFYHQDTIITIV